jgi:hypothetical protein
LLQDHEAKLEALRLGVMEQELTQIHVSTTCAHENTTALDLDRSDFGADKVPARCQFDEGQACCQLVDQVLIPLFQSLLGVETLIILRFSWIKLSKEIIDEVLEDFLNSLICLIALGHFHSGRSHELQRSFVINNI